MLISVYTTDICVKQRLAGYGEGFFAFLRTVLGPTNLDDVVVNKNTMASFFLQKSLISRTFIIWLKEHFSCAIRAGKIDHSFPLSFKVANQNTGFASHFYVHCCIVPVDSNLFKEVLDASDLFLVDFWVETPMMSMGWTVGLITLSLGLNIPLANAFLVAWSNSLLHSC